MYNLGGAMIAEISELTADHIAIALRVHALVKVPNGQLLPRLAEAMLEHMRSSRSTPRSLTLSLWSLVQLQKIGYITVPSELLLGAGRMATEHREAFSMEQLVL